MTEKKLINSLMLKNKNAKLYWNMFKELSHVKPAGIPLSSFEEYFKSVNNPLDPFLPQTKMLYTFTSDMLTMNFV